MPRALAFITNNQLKEERNQMKIQTLAVALLSAGLLAGCQKAAKAPAEEAAAAEEQVPTAPYAELIVPERVDMGVFEGDNLKKTTTLQLSNVGTDTLFILSVIPDCDCTGVVYVDSVVAPQSRGRLELSLDLSGYPADTIYKDVGILSNNRKGRSQKITVFGLRQ